MALIAPAPEPALTASTSGQTAAAPLRQSRRIPQLDGLRGCAILIVLVCHYVNNATAADAAYLPAILRAGLSLTWSGVDLFFVLSGFLIGSTLLEHRQSRHYYTTFYVRRSFRILPIYALCMLSFLAFTRWFPWRGQEALDWLVADHGPSWIYLAFGQNFLMAHTDSLSPKWLSPTWSLAVEEQFYLLLPLLIRLVPSRYLMRTLLALVVVAPLFRAWLVLGSGYGAVSAYVLLPARMDALLLGVIAAVLFRQPQFREQVRQSQRSIWICVILLGAALLFFAMQGFGLGSVLMSVIGFSVIAYFYLGVLILTLCSKNATLSRVLTFKPLRFLGQVSFFVYLFHYPVLGIVHHVLRGRTPSFADGVLPTLLALGITLLAGWVSWHFLEKHLVGMGHRFSYGSARGAQR